MNRPQIDLTGAKILAVDDVPANLDVLSQALEAGGYNVLVATSGETALDLVTRIEPDLILLDVMMPGIDGFETCRRLKASEETEEIPVVFLTARNELEGVLEGFQAGGVDYISKPFQKDEVLVRIRTHLERAYLAKALAELNAQLEQKVADRTRELRRKVVELEGRDRIAQHLLTYHALEETLTLVLQVIVDVTSLDRVIFYRLEETVLVPVAAIGAFEPGQVAAPDRIKQVQPTAAHQEAIQKICESRTPMNVEQPEAANEIPFVVVPILRGDEVLGVIVANNFIDKSPIDVVAIDALASFALQAAVAISDAQFQQDANHWQEQLDQVLQLDDIAESMSFLDNLPDKQASE
ncbi:MAG: response regulator [Candidatus Latescibacteria bacterium]|jgi:DNA-binding response OmpR family regulator|nr:response regulator [Candidatus Latescibacterota bacterium]